MTGMVNKNINRQKNKSTPEHSLMVRYEILSLLGAAEKNIRHDCINKKNMFHHW